MVMIPHIYVTSALSSHHSAKICHTPVFDYRSGIETAGGKFKKNFTHNNRRSRRIFKSTKYGIGSFRCNGILAAEIC